MEAERKNILKELERLQVHFLTEAKSKENISGVPDAYFQLLPSAILHDIDKITAQGIPDGYFDELSSIVLQKVDALEENKPTPVINFQKYRRRQRTRVVNYLAKSGVAAAILISLIFSIKNLYFKNTEDPCAVNDLACIKQQDIYQYLYENTVTVPITDDESLQSSTNNNIDTNEAAATSKVVQEFTPQEATDLLSPTEEEVLLEETLHIF